MRIISENIKQRRTELGYSAADVAAALDINLYEYVRYEEAGGRKRIKPTVITKLAQVLQCSPSDFMDWTIESPPKKTVRKATSNTITLYNGRSYRISDLPEAAQDELANFITHLTEKYSTER